MVFYINVTLRYVEELLLISSRIKTLIYRLIIYCSCIRTTKWFELCQIELLVIEEIGLNLKLNTVRLRFIKRYKSMVIRRSFHWHCWRNLLINSLSFFLIEPFKLLFSELVTVLDHSVNKQKRHFSSSMWHLLIYVLRYEVKYGPEWCIGVNKRGTIVLTYRKSNGCDAQGNRFPRTVINTLRCNRMEYKFARVCMINDRKFTEFPLYWQWRMS